MSNTGAKQSSDIKFTRSNNNTGKNAKWINNDNSSMYSDNSETEKYYTIREFACKLRDAVVSITGQVLIKNKTHKLELLHGNGFFIKGHYIICPAELIITTPIFDNTDILRATKILADVSNVNGTGISYTYDTIIVGIDAAANIAILHIDMNTQWNKSNPIIKDTHPYLHWGKSRSSCPGDTVLVIGNISAPSNICQTNNILQYPGAENAVAIGNLSDNRYVFPGGNVPGELLLLSNITTNGYQRGLPVISTSGSIIGMTLHIESNVNYNVALAEFFMRRPVKALIRAYLDDNIPDHYRGFIQKVNDPINTYYKFNKSWLGVVGFLMGQDDYNTTIIYSKNKFVRKPIVINDKLYDGPSCKEIVGYRVLSLKTGDLYSKQSPLINILSTGDIITRINDCPLGDRKGQISPSLIMWRVRPGDTVTLHYKKQSEKFEHTHESIVCTESYDHMSDFPFYSMSHDIPISPILM